ncbi:MAG: class I SAM-dependent methyltransferase [candidate division Zixibacteria bacterium]|nr:class I SAM-dependent methyltransferase [candidate division Zixibacteria bacterium]
MHKLKDLKTIEHLFVKGWDTPVASLVGKGVERRDRGSLMERAVKSSNLVQRSDGNRRFGRNDFGAWVNELTAPLKYRTVLDVCCGTGNQLLHFASRSGLEELVGVDLSGDSLEKARGRLAETGFDGKLSLLKTSLEEMFSRSELSGTKFDLISCFYGLYYSRNVEDTLHGMLNHLSEHGTLLIVGPYGKNNTSLFELLQRHFSLPDGVLRSATTFMEQEVHPVLTAHTDVEAVTFVNPVEYPEPQALIEYWRASTFYSKEHEPAVERDVEDHFRRNGSFIVEKHVMAYVARKA